MKNKFELYQLMQLLLVILLLLSYHYSFLLFVELMKDFVHADYLQGSTALFLLPAFLSVVILILPLLRLTKDQRTEHKLLAWYNKNRLYGLLLMLLGHSSLYHYFR